MAERTGAAIVVVMHLNQATLQPALYRVQGSIGYVGAARSVLLVVKDKDNPAQRVVAQIKANLAAEMPAVAFTITDEPILAWQSVVEVDIAELLSATASEEGSAREEAKTFLEELLGPGDVPAKQVLAEARECGISEKTLRRAAKDMSVDIGRTGEHGKKGGGSWVWRLSDRQDSAQEAGLDGQDAPHVKSGHLDNSGHLNAPSSPIKMATTKDLTDTNPIKMATQNTWGKMGTLINTVPESGHLNTEPAPSDESSGHLNNGQLDAEEPGDGGDRHGDEHHPVIDHHPDDEWDYPDVEVVNLDVEVIDPDVMEVD